MAEFEVYRREKKYHVHEIILKWIVDITMVVCLSFILATYMLGKTTVVGHSMEPTLENDDSLLVDKVSYCFRQPERYDVIVFEPAIANVSKYYVKRIVGLPGETIQIIDGVVYINGEPLENDVIYSFGLKDEAGKPVEPEKIYNAGLAEKPITLGYDEYFVLGDNRNNSEDSRFSNVGNVKYSAIIGRIWAVSSPFGRMGLVK
ncbi:MAG TPA: signal peptidase I [Eubacterium sp.]|jgi:signal peptidase I|nr:signal peptidase I [Eubacterium sp.]HAX59792.1 signal peptidase I [Eubacterium sp.]HAZ87123.1 signal peptidase I [Eubacterium sp.]